jgi:hypothetical protein
MPHVVESVVIYSESAKAPQAFILVDMSLPEAIHFASTFTAPIGAKCSPEMSLALAGRVIAALTEGDVRD